MGNTGQTEWMIPVYDGFHLTRFSRKDKFNLLTYLNDKIIHENTIHFPFPYQEQHADQWLDFLEDLNNSETQPTKLAIREPKGQLIGGIGFQTKYGRESHADEIGYWMAKPYRNKGIMSRIIPAACQYGFEKLGLVRIEAGIFPHNHASGKVLEKCGFQKEGYLNKSHQKNGQYLDTILYSIIAPGF